MRAVAPLEGDDAPMPSEVDWDSMLAQLATQPVEEGWVTLLEASNAAGVSRSTLRSWYRSAQIPSRMVAGTHGPQRMVLLEAVIDRAFRSSAPEGSWRTPAPSKRRSMLCVIGWKPWSATSAFCDHRYGCAVRYCMAEERPAALC